MTQRDGWFTADMHPHNHPGVVGALAATTIKAKVKEAAREDIFKPASASVNEVSHKAIFA